MLNALDRARGDYARAKDLFRRDVDMFRDTGVDMRTVAAHSELMLRTKGYSWNIDLFKRFPDLPSECGVDEAYQLYRSQGLYRKEQDSHTRFVGDNFYRILKLRRTIAQQEPYKGVHMLFHPHRWRESVLRSLGWVVRDIVLAGCNRTGLRKLNDLQS